MALSEREHQQILALAKQGLTQTQIGERMQIGRSTVNSIIERNRGEKLARGLRANTDDIVAKYRNGMTTRQIADGYGVNPPAIATILRLWREANGVPTVRKGRQSPRRAPNKGGNQYSDKPLPERKAVPVPDGYIEIAPNQVMKRETFERYSRYFWVHVPREPSRKMGMTDRNLAKQAGYKQGDHGEADE